MSDQQEKLVRGLKPWKILLPIGLGLAVVIYMFWKEFDAKAFSSLIFTISTLGWLGLAIFMMLWRDAGYLIRLRVLSEGKLSWAKILRIVFLWEFASSVTPSAVGGTTVAVIFIHKEGLSVGRSTAIVMATSFLDELFFILMFPALVLLVNAQELFMIEPGDSLWTNNFLYFALVGYSIKIGWMVFMGYGLFINPHFVKRVVVFIFRLKFLRKWKSGAIKAGNDIVMASSDLKKKPIGFWLKAFFATALSWIGRYWVFNFLLLALLVSSPGSIGDGLLSFSDHIMVFSKQLVMWIMMLVSPTPGASGFAEWIFAEFLGSFIPVAGLIGAMALSWRLITYYPYLIIGILILPKWINRVFTKKTNL
ncbi:MAG: flippase-like domain-containing protein [Bacteroidales bacterium]|nr:flippase-like domain-containing protein [Bacteroidales bacterium]